MCGIAGIIADRADVADDLQRMLASLAHRGPDGEGTLQDNHAAFGHRRLSIIDLERGQQPLRSADGSLWLVCNGEIYNYRELRADLQKRGYRFTTHSDCEVILGLYAFHGVRLFEHLRGMFAFALWDTRQRRLLLARDHLGQKPLYYAATGRGFAFASEIKGLLAFDPSLRRLNLAALDQYFALRLVAPPQSMFEGVRKLPPGHYMLCEPGKAPAVQSYWRLRYDRKLTGSMPQLVDELEQRIAESLRLHMVSDVPVGAFLSGGLDSGLLVAMLAKHLGVRDLQTFTIGLPYAQFDEAPAARAVAEDSRTRHYEQRLTPSLTALLPDLIHHLDEPSDPLSFCAWQSAALARRHVKVVIGGDGGDELFGGYDRYYGNLYAEHYRRLPVALRRFVVGPVLSLIPGTRWYKSIGHQARWLHRLSFLSGSDRYAASLSYFYFEAAARRSLFTEDVQRTLEREDAEAAIRVPFDATPGDDLDRMLSADSQVRLPDHPVMITDRMTMAHGLEARSPFMDHRLAEFAASIPSSMKVQGRSLRIIQKQLAARYLPVQALSRPKQGFASALPYLLRNEYQTLYDRLLKQSALVEDGILRQEPIELLLQAHRSRQADHGNRLWLLINADLWYRMAIRGLSRSDALSLLAPASLSTAA
jgi:asparagine synthase (glutamine-hydrolysing)